MFKKSLYLSVSLLAFNAVAAQAELKIPSDADQTCLADVKPWFGGTSPTSSSAAAAPDSLFFTDVNANDGKGPNVCNFYQWGAQAFLWMTSPEDDGLVLDSDAIYNVLPGEMDADGKTTRQLQDAGTAAMLQVAMRSEKTDDVGEIGQAGGGGVLLSQAGSLVYYGVHVNDLYADFLTGQKTTGSELSAHNNFPINLSDYLEVIAFVDKHGMDAPVAGGTLAMELKTSWVDLESITKADRPNFITMPAIVPNYQRGPGDVENVLWQVSATTPTKQITLALVGMHLVGTVQDHPEFVWATFEHVMNAPDAAYWYNANNSPKQAPFDPTGSFLFNTSKAIDPANLECAQTGTSGSTGDIVAGKDESGTLNCPGGIVPSNTVRTRPWGSNTYGPSDIGTTVTQNGKPVTLTQDEVDQVIENNTMLLSINANVRSQMASDDPRSNYVLVGGVWTTTPDSGGDAPIPVNVGYTTPEMRGSLGLYNATMETYSEAFAQNCFVCHSLPNAESNSFVPRGLSHIYSEIDTLPID